MTGNVFINPDTAPGPAAVVDVLRPDRDGHLFVGRAQEVEQLLGLLAPAPGTTKPVVVSAMRGMGGVGKTTLAVRAAMLAAGRGWFPGGAVLVRLDGYEAAPVRPAQVYAPMLRILGTPDQRIPSTVDLQATEYHDLLGQLAELGRRVLVVLDNVAEPTQIRDLLPRSNVHRVLVTTRDDIFNPAAVRSILLDVLTEAEAIDLLNRTLRAVDPADARPDREPAAVAHLVRLCGLLPLAVDLAAAILADEPTSSVAALAAEFADEDARVSGLRHDVRDIASVIGFSYQRLAARDPGAARLLALLTLHPGPDLATETAAALAGCAPGAAATLLRILRTASLLKHTDGRWQLHDLVAGYARRHLTADVATAATTRLLDHYLRTAEAADDHLQALRGQPVPDRFTGRDDARAWFHAERASLTALVAHAHRTGRYRETCDLASAIADYLRGHRHLTDWITVAEHAAAAATALGNPQRLASVLNRLGFALCAVWRFDEAITAHEKARDIYREFEDRHGEAIAWNGLGLALSERGRFADAVAAHEQARDIFRQFEDHHGEAMAWNNLGIALCELERFDDALASHEQALAIHRALGDGRREALAYHGMGKALRLLGKTAEAVAAQERARDLFREFEDHHREAQAWNSLGLSLCDARRFDEAIAAHRRARDLFRELRDRHGEAAASHNLGVSLRTAQRFDEAVAIHREEIEIWRKVDDRADEGGAWNRLGLALNALKRFDEARAAHEQARDIYREIGDHHGEGAAWNNLGIALRGLKRFDEAITAHENDLRIFRDFGERRGEGVSWNNLGIVLTAAGRLDEAIAAHRHAQDLCRRAGDHRGQGLALIWSGHALYDTGKRAEAIREYSEAVTVFAGIGDEQTADEIREGLRRIRLRGTTS